MHNVGARRENRPDGRSRLRSGPRLATVLAAAAAFAVAAVVAGMPGGAAPSHAAAPRDVRPGAVLLRLDGSVPPVKLRAALPRGAALRAAVAPTMFGAMLRDVAVPPGAEADFAARIATVPGVAWAEVDPAVRGTLTPDDPYFAEQWHLPAVRLPEAWSVVTDAVSIPVAILDTGVRLDHPDLVGQIWRHPGETEGNGVDDDGNGFVDDVSGWHFYQKYVAGFAFPRDDADIADPHGHGTFTAGIVGARGGNGVGVTGAAWRATMMIVRVLDDDSVGWESDVVRGLDYATRNGARVINLSFGAPYASRALVEALARCESAGALVVAAAGNDGGAVASPAALPSVLAVGASDRDRRRAAFSSYGPSLDLVAPGTQVLSTWNGRPYLVAEGTSAAAPLVAGVAALMLARRPEMTPAQVRACLALTASDIDAPGRDDRTGAGLLDAARAVRGCPPPLHMPGLAIAREPD